MVDERERRKVEQTYYSEFSIYKEKLEKSFFFPNLWFLSGLLTNSN